MSPLLEVKLNFEENIDMSHMDLAVGILFLTFNVCVAPREILGVKKVRCDFKNGFDPVVIALL